MLGVAFFRKPGRHIYLGVGSLDSWIRAHVIEESLAVLLYFRQVYSYASI